MMTRRELLAASARASLAVLGGGTEQKRPTIAASTAWTVPPETDPHDRCWMAWPARADVWGDLLEGVRDDVARVAAAISRFELVTVLCRPTQLHDARRRLPRSARVLAGAVDDCWMRDSGPVFIRKGARLAAVDLNFNGWGNRQTHEADATVARQVAQRSGVPLRRAGLVAEGGGLEFDGAGTVMATAPSVVNANRNPGRGRDELTNELRAAFGVRKVIWLPGGWTDITDGHVDAFARFTAPGEVLVEMPSNRRDADFQICQENLAAVRAARDAAGRILRVTVFERAPQALSESLDFCPCAINFYVANGAIVMARFDDERTHRAARAAIGRAFPGREVVAVPIPALADGGGGIHCITQQQPTGLQV